MTSKTAIIKNVTTYSAYLLIVWAFYRFLFQLPDTVEELVVKPIVWLLPLYWFIKKEGFGFSSLGFTLKKLFPAIYLSIGLGAVFVMEGVFSNFLKYGKLNFGANLGSMPFLATLGLSLATAFSEELAFRGYIFGRLNYVLKNEWSANIISTLIWTAIHVPIAFFVWKMNMVAGLIYLFLTAIFGFGASFIYGKTGNIFGPVLLHVLWEWPIMLFR